MGIVKDGKAINFLVQPELYDAIKKEADNRYMTIGAFLRMILAERYYKIGK